MGLPFLVLGTFSQAIARMPKSGRWMETVKSVFGLLMLGAGLYYLQIGLPAVARLFAPLGAHGLVLGPVLVAAGVVLGALHLSFKYTSLLEKARKGGGVALATLGVVSFLTWTNAPKAAPPSPTSAVGGEKVVGTGHIEWVKIGGKDGDVAVFDAALAAAKRDCKPVMIDFGAEWCIACKEIEKYVHTDAAVAEEARRFVNIKVDATEETPALTTLQQRYGVVGLPTIVFIDKSGRYADDNREPRHPAITGFMPALDYLTRMQKVP
jgi:thiol:disulfide interchange protein DsbD